MFLLERGLELRIAVGSKGTPIEGGLEPFAVGRAEPQLHRQAAFADRRMRLQCETLVEFHLEFWSVRLAVLITRWLGILEFQLPARPAREYL